MSFIPFFNDTQADLTDAEAAAAAASAQKAAKDAALAILANPAGKTAEQLATAQRIAGKVDTAGVYDTETPLSSFAGAITKTAWTVVIIIGIGLALWFYVQLRKSK